MARPSRWTGPAMLALLVGVGVLLMNQTSSAESTTDDTPAPTPTGAPPSRASERPPQVGDGRGRPHVLAPDAGSNGRLLRLVMHQGDTASVRNLPVTVEVRCGPRGLEWDRRRVDRRDLRTNAEGELLVPGVGPDCELRLLAKERALSLAVNDDGEVDARGGPGVRLIVVDREGSPIAGASIIGGRAQSDASGHLLVWRDELERDAVTVTAPGYRPQRVPRDADPELHDVKVVLLPGLKLTVDVRAPSATLLVPMTLAIFDERVASSFTDRYQLSRTIDAPGRYEFDTSPETGHGVALAELQPRARADELPTRPMPFGEVMEGVVAAAMVPAGQPEVVLTLVPRRLELSARPLPEIADGLDHPTFVAIACPATGLGPIMLFFRGAPTERSETVHLEYAPPGPCTVTRQRFGADDQSPLPATRVDPPTSIVLE